MDTIVVIIVSITLLAILGSIYLEMRRQTKPRIKVYFPNGSTRTSYKAKEEASIAIHIKNIGRFGFPKPAATNTTIFVYTPTGILLKSLQHLKVSVTDVAKAPSGGIFGGMHYLGIGKAFSLFYKEEEVIKVVMQIPDETGKYTIKVPIFSAEGDLGVHNLDITAY